MAKKRNKKGSKKVRPDGVMRVDFNPAIAKMMAADGGMFEFHMVPFKAIVSINGREMAIKAVFSVVLHEDGDESLVFGFRIKGLTQSRQIEAALKQDSEFVQDAAGQFVHDLTCPHCNNHPSATAELN